MKNTLRLFLFVVVLQFSACKPALYKNFIDIPSYVWKKDNTVVFTVEMEKPITVADVRLAIRYVDGYLYDHLKVNVKRISPSNKKSEQELNIKIMDGNEGYVGEGMGDLWDLEQALTGDFQSFEETGTYQYEVSQTMQDDQFPLVVEVGLIVEEKAD